MKYHPPHLQKQKNNIYIYVLYIHTSTYDTNYHVALRSQYANVRRAWTVAAYEAAPIVMQPDSEVMLRGAARLRGDAARPLTQSRDVVATWREPFYHRLMLAGWNQLAKEARDGEAKKPRTE